MATKYLKYHIILISALINIGCNGLQNKLSDDDFVLCDHKNYKNSIRGKFCKIECYTTFGNPGICQTHALNSCKTSSVNTKSKNCSQKDTKFETICCPFEGETQLTPTSTLTPTKLTPTSTLTPTKLTPTSTLTPTKLTTTSTLTPTKLTTTSTLTPTKLTTTSTLTPTKLTTTSTLTPTKLTTTSTLTPTTNKPTTNKPMPQLPFNDIECGERPDIAAIVGGFDSEPNTWPWMVSIYEKVSPSSDPQFICGGAIISNNYILSAAHCVVRIRGDIQINANKYFVKLGAYRLSDKNIKFRELSQIIPHKRYNTRQGYYDIALLRVKYPIQFNPTVSPICLPKGKQFDKDFVGHSSKLLGWGTTQYGGSISDTLKEVNVDIIDNSDCNRNYSKLNGHQISFPSGINNQFVCAGFTVGGKDSCQGDSGGPLAVQMGEKWYEFGIVSFGYKCAEPGFPGIYTSVKHFISWIESNVR